LIVFSKFFSMASWPIMVPAAELLKKASLVYRSATPLAFPALKMAMLSCRRATTAVREERGNVSNAARDFGEAYERLMCRALVRPRNQGRLATPLH
jgi:hypothetical protein